ncbi:MAG: TIR domain-containing protein, partial [Leptolyngbya sp. SIO4C5]|nr:TIR domain-containing protein [Leptolyngbya sp. SIO4C5]
IEAIKEYSLSIIEEIINCAYDLHKTSHLNKKNLESILVNSISVPSNLSENSNSDIRAKSFRILSSIQSQDSLPIFRKGLKDPYFSVRAYAALAVGKIQDDQSISSLLELLKDESPDVRAAAADALGKISQKTASLAEYLPYLVNLIPQNADSEEDFLRLVATVQFSYKFYNYEIVHNLIPPGQPISLYIAYHPTDETLQTQLTHHLTPLDRQNLITPWSKRHLLPGDNRDQAIHHQLHTADIILLLISPDALADDTTYHHEILPALNRTDQAHILPILLRPTDYAATPLSQLPHLPKNGQAIATWDNPDEAFQEIAETIREIALKLRSAIKSAADDTLK